MMMRTGKNNLYQNLPPRLDKALGALFNLLGRPIVSTGQNP